MKVYNNFYSSFELLPVSSRDVTRRENHFNLQVPGREKWDQSISRITGIHCDIIFYRE
jgi:hypothetical protein